MDKMTGANGVFETGIPGVNLIRITCVTPKFNIIYQPSIAIIVQGAKRGFIGDEVYTYNENNYLVLSVPLPFESQIIEASPEKPLLSLDIAIEPDILSEIMVGMKNEFPPVTQMPKSIHATPLSDQMIDASLRLLESAGNSTDCRILSPQIKREILYRVLCGQQGDCLRALVAHNGKFSQIAKVVDLIHNRYAEPFDVNTMAGMANMSVSSFHLNFKKVTMLSPLQYLKSIRLHKARQFMLQDGLNVSMVADRVGYASVSQFSREFKRFFGTNPSNEV